MNIKFNNETIKNAIMDALDKKERGIEISEVDRNELINVILKYGDRDFGIKNKDSGKYYTEEELQYSVYIHINEVDENKCYIGRTSLKPKDRWNNGKGYKCQLIYDDIKKYGWENFSHVILCYGLNKEEADNMEIKLISIFKTTNEKFSYNIELGGNSVGKHSNETRKKISEAIKGEKHYFYGKKHSTETIKKISEANKGENNPMYGKKRSFSEETRKKISEAVKGEKHPMYGKDRSGENAGNAKKIHYNGMIFSTAKEFAKFCNVDRHTITNWLKGKYKTPSKKLSKLLELGLRYATEEDINTYPLYIEEEQK